MKKITAYTLSALLIMPTLTTTVSANPATLGERGGEGEQQINRDMGNIVTADKIKFNNTKNEDFKSSEEKQKDKEEDNENKEEKKEDKEIKEQKNKEKRKEFSGTQLQERKRLSDKNQKKEQDVLEELDDKNSPDNSFDDFEEDIENDYEDFDDNKDNDLEKEESLFEDLMDVFSFGYDISGASQSELDEITSYIGDDYTGGLNFSEQLKPSKNFGDPYEDLDGSGDEFINIDNIFFEKNLPVVKYGTNFEYQKEDLRDCIYFTLDKTKESPEYYATSIPLIREDVISEKTKKKESKYKISYSEQLDDSPLEKEKENVMNKISVLEEIAYFSKGKVMQDYEKIMVYNGKNIKVFKNKDDILEIAKGFNNDKVDVKVGFYETGAKLNMADFLKMKGFFEIIVDGHKMVLTTNPATIKGIPLIPIRDVANALNCKVSWNPKTYTAVITKQDSKTGEQHKIIYNSKGKIIDSSGRHYDSIAKINDEERLLAGITCLCKEMNAEIFWDAKLNKMIIESQEYKEKLKHDNIEEYRRNRNTSAEDRNEMIDKQMKNKKKNKK